MRPGEDITPSSREGAWSAKTLIRDKRRGKSHTVEIDVVARRPGQMRMEVTTPLGFHVASLALDGEEVAYAITREKKYFSGPAEPAVMKNLINVSLDPKSIMDLLFDRPLDAKTWECRTDVNRLPEDCESRGGGLRIAWSERTSDKRLVRIRAADAEVTMSLVETRSKVRITDGLFSLEQPAGFKRLQGE